MSGGAEPDAWVRATPVRLILAKLLILRPHPFIQI